MLVKCKDCIFVHETTGNYLLHGTRTTGILVECRRNPPSIIDRDSNNNQGHVTIESYWPVVGFSDNDFCYSGQESLNVSWANIENL